MAIKKLQLAPVISMIVLGMLTVWLSVSGCGNDPANSFNPPDEETQSNPSPEGNQPKKFAFTQWDQPAAVLILSGQQHGYLEPCGCSETQSGGLARRADLLNKLKAKNWPVAGLDLGSSLRLVKSKSGVSIEGTALQNKPQEKLKLDTLLKSLKALNYTGMGLGYEELLLSQGDIDLLYNSYQPQLNSNGQNVRPAFLGANILLYETEEIGPNRTQIIKLGEIKIGVTAIAGNEIRKKLYGNNPPGIVEIKQPADMLPNALKVFHDEKTDFNVLLSQAELAETKTLLEQYPDFAIAVCQSSEAGKEQPTLVGKTQVIRVGRKGKEVGVLAFYPDDAKQKFRFELVELDNKRFKNDPSIEPFLVEYQHQLEKNMEEIFSSQHMTQGFHPNPGEFVGASVCGDCHSQAYDKWKSTPHAHAYETLKTGREGQYSQPISRIHDAECLACHVTGWDPQGVFAYDSGFLPQKIAQAKKNPNLFANLQGQQCENCHGPGSLHVAQEELFINDPDKSVPENRMKFQLQMRLTKAEAKETLFCEKCHDTENDPHFDFDPYWEKINHPWRD